MNSDRFDALARRMATGATSRRRFLGGLGGALAAAVLVGAGKQPALAASRLNAGIVNPAAGRHAKNAAPHPLSGGVCDNCDSVCSNCPMGCCLALGDPSTTPQPTEP